MQSTDELLSSFKDAVILRFFNVCKKKLGEGTFCTVYKAQRKDTKDVVALKSFRHEFNDTSTRNVHIEEELAVLKKVGNHPHIVKYLYYLHKNNENRPCYLIFEYVKGGHLHSLLQESGRITDVDRLRRFTFQIVSALAHCHSQNVIHCDVKPQNILVGDDDNLKLCDFGNSVIVDPNDPAQCLPEEMTTFPYAAPEMLLYDKRYDYSVDMWAVACVYADMQHTPTEPLFGMWRDDSLEEIFKIIGTPPASEWPADPHIVKRLEKYEKHPSKTFSEILPTADDDARDFVARLFVFTPSKRMTAVDALEHVYLRALSKIT